MIHAVFAGIISMLMVITLPAALLAPPEKQEVRSAVLVKEQSVLHDKEETIIKLCIGDEIVRIPLEEYLTGVILSEMPASFDMEALKAQAVASRTFTVYRLDHEKHSGYDVCADSSCCQAWNNYEAISGKIGDALWEKGAQAVHETTGEIMTYQGMPVEAVYFSCSGGSTESAVSVWGGDVPYLQSVSSSGEELSSKYKSEITVSAAEFKDIIKRENSNVVFSVKSGEWIGAVEHTEGGGVKRIQVGGVWFSGTKMRSLFGLNSTKFSVFAEDNGIVFEVYGNGHRVGMSQYGANAMAQTGKNYREILTHYYTGVCVEEWE